MSTNTRNARLGISLQLPFLCGLILAAGSISGQAGVEPAQNGRGQQPPVQVPNQQQRDQQYDQAQQQRDQIIRDEALRRSTDQIGIAEEEAWQRARLQQLLRENFRHHYKILRTNADKLAQLASDLQARVDSNSDDGLPRDKLAQAAALEKLAHEIRTTLADRSLPRMKRLNPAGRSVAAGATATMDARQLLLQRINAASALAGTIKQITEQYMASDNEQAVSVDALKRAAGKAQPDQRLVLIMNASAQLERVAYDLRTLTKAIPQ